MKLIKLVKSILTVMSIIAILTSCTKEGAVGPRGELGEDGSTILSGTTAPGPTIGKVGDYYFRISNSDFYGPKTASGWGTATNLKGTAGAEGAAILSGTTVPNATQGRTGDFYFKINTGDFYGPKTAAGWGTPLNLKGSTGAKGSDGATIISGTAAPTNAIGALGDFYFQLLAGNFYGPKTAAGWGTPTNLKGANGATGASGSRILSGTTAPSSTLGLAGDFYFNRNTADFYGPKSGTSWGTPVNLKGPAGPQGPPGSANVIYSPWMLISNLDGTYEIPAKELTEAILNGGHIAVYAKEYKGDLLLGINQLPFISRHSGTLIEFELKLNTIIVYSNGRALNNWGTEFRYIIIPGGVFTPDGRSQLQDYNVVRKLYNLPD